MFQLYIILMSFRFYTYKKLRWHYFLIDFCYFTNNLVLLYVWSPWKLGWLFPVIYVFSMGPLMFGVILLRNSLVPHSLDKMTSLFIHNSPLIVVWGLKWYESALGAFTFTILTCGYHTVCIHVHVHVQIYTCISCTDHGVYVFLPNTVIAKPSVDDIIIHTCSWLILVWKSRSQFKLVYTQHS